MKIEILTNAATEEYRKLLCRAVEENSESFRIGIADVAGAPPFASEGENDFTLGAFDEDGNLIGVVSFSREKQEKLRHKGLIYRMYVAEKSAGRGIGRMLLRTAIGKARNFNGLERIILTVVADNKRAKNLYASEGFETFSREKNSIKIGARYFDEETTALTLCNSKDEF